MAGTKTQQSLEERVAQLRAELDAFIEERVGEIAKECPGVPSGVLRRTLEGNEAGCLCNVFRALNTKGEQ